MTTGRKMLVCLTAWALMSASALADTPTVSNIVAKQRYPWNGLVDITCTVSGIDGATDELKFAVAALEPESGSTNKLSHLWVMRDGTRLTDLTVPTNGNYRLLWDATENFGEVNRSNMVVRISLKEVHSKVQLWEGGPYWAETNIGAEEPWESGLYFWWGDTIGYRRENDAWVASNGSATNFSFKSGNAPTYNKNSSTLQSGGWITANNVLAPEHDAAQIHWGGSWRMPTKQELSDLNNKCDWTWMTNGVPGYSICGTGTYASASIFIPAVGRGFETSLSLISTHGFYWSSVPGSSRYYAWHLSCASGGHHMYTDWGRYDGFPVRPLQGFSEAPSMAAANAGDSAPFPLDTRKGTRSARATEPLAYSTAWNNATGVTISIDGTEVFSAAAPASGDYIWNTEGILDGLHTITFNDGTETLSAQFATGVAVLNVAAKQRYPWNGLVDITCTVSGIDGTANGLWFAVAVVDPDSGDVRDVSHFGILRSGTNSNSRTVHTNGNYRLLWDARTDLGEVICSNMALRVALTKAHRRVQLWAEGPYWAETNIGAEEPWEYGWYFWWGGTAGYRRENNVWVSSSGSSSGFSFSSGNTPIYNKKRAVLQNEGWITADNVLARWHDAAWTHWGGSWRMPNCDELSALNNNCDWAWTTMKGVNGYIVRGRGNFASASIFLPAAGVGRGTSLNSADSYGYYWSSVPCEDDYYDESRILYFYSGYHNADYYASDRYCGLPIRPVQGFADAIVLDMTDSLAGDSAPFPLDTRTGVRVAREMEPLAYSTVWNADVAGVSISLDSVELFSAAAPAVGDFVWNASSALAGIHELSFTDGVETQRVEFGVNPSTVLFGANGGEGTMEPFHLFSGAEQTLPPCEFTNTNGFFLGWALTADGEATLFDGDSTADIAVEPGETITLYAIWHKENTSTCAICFDANGGNGVMPKWVFALGEDVMLPHATFTRNGYIFAGWALEEDGIVCYKDRTVLSNFTTVAGETVILYAVWANALVTFDENGGNGTMEPFFLFAEAEQSLPLCAFSNTNGFFLGWALSADGEATLLDGDSTADIVVVPGETVTLYAVWHEGNGGKGLSVKYYDISSSGYSTWTQSEAAMTNYFVGRTPTIETNTLDWGETLDVGFSSSIGSEGNSWISAGLTRPDSTCHFHGGYASNSKSYFALFLNGCLHIVDSGVYEFAAVADDAVVVYIDGELVLYNGSNWGTMSTCQKSLSLGPHTVSIGFYEASGGQGLSIQWKKPGDTSYSPLPQSVLSYGMTAYAVSFDANGGDGAVAKQVYPSGEDVTLPSASAFARDGCTFVGWATEPDGPIVYGDGETIAEGIDAASGETITLYARWSLGTYTVHFDANGGTGALADQMRWLGIPEVLNSNTFSRTGYTFSGWAESAEGEVLYTDNALVTNLANAVGAMVTLYAEWTPNEYNIRFHDEQQGLLVSYYDIASISDSSWYNNVNTYEKCLAYHAALTPTIVANTADCGDIFDFGITGSDTSAVFHGKYADGNGAENFVAMFWGFIEIPEDGSYSFRIHHDNGCVIYVDKQLVYGYSGLRNWTTFSCLLTAGSKEIIMALHEGTGDQRLQLQMQGPSDAAMTGLSQSILSYGTPPVNQTFTYDSSQPLATDTFARTGYTLAGWATEKDGTVAYADGATVQNLATNAGDVVDLHAIWTTNTYTVCFDANGGVGTMADQPFVYDEAVALSTNVFTRANRFFAGWAMEAGGAAVFADGEVVSNLTAAANGVVTLHAVWAEADGRILFDANGGEGRMTPFLLYAEAVQMLPPCSFSSTNGFFLGWALSADGEATLFDGDSTDEIAVEPGGTITLYAVWEPLPPFIVIDLSAGSSAESYPVSYLSAPPEGGFNADEYKTSKLVMRHIPVGTFTMGSPVGEVGRSDTYEAQHDVTLECPFYMGVFEVTQRQWELVMGSTPSSHKGDCRPVECVSYNDIRGSSFGAQWPASSAVDATSFIGRLRSRTGCDTFDLPTEAQWEYACRAGTMTALNSGINLANTGSDTNMAEVGRYSYNRSDGKGGYSQHTTVGSYLPNAWGLYDMHGNVWEWCLDWWQSSLDTMAVTDPQGAATGSDRSVRGGGYQNDALYCRSAYRCGYCYPSGRYGDYGLRLSSTIVFPSTYAIRFDANDGEGAMAKRVYASGEYVTLPSATLTRDGYTFAGWATDPNGPIAYEDGETIEGGFDAENGETITLYALWLYEPLEEVLDATNLIWRTGGDRIWHAIKTEEVPTGGFGRSGAIGNGESSWVETTVKGAGTLSFKWRTSCQNRLDMIRLAVDGENKNRLFGQSSWETVSVEVSGVAEHTFRWTFTRGASGSAGENCAWLDEVVWMPDMAANARALTVASRYDVCEPAIGTHPYAWGDDISASAGAFYSNGLERATCTGWTGTGSVPATGAETNTTFTLEGDSTLTWSWATEYRLDLGVEGEGTLSRESDWLAEGAMEVITATPGLYQHFVRWEGDTDSCRLTGAILRAPMTKGRSIRAVFEQATCTLSIADALGAAWPTNGLHTFDMGTQISAWSTNVVAGDRTRYLCTGWTGTGSVLASGAGTNAVFTLLEDSSIAWTWQTNYLVRVTVVGDGTTDIGEAWIAAGSNLVVTATPGGTAYTAAVWSGDIEGAVPDGLRITIPVDGPKDISIAFNALSVGRALEQESRDWMTGSDGAPWTPVTSGTHDGIDACMSGAIVGGYGESVLSATFSGAGDLSFWWRLGDSTSTCGIDLYVDGQDVNVWLVDAAGWTQETISLGEGDHVVEWIFWGDGLDPLAAAWLDEVEFTGNEEPSTETQTTPVHVPYVWLDAFNLGDTTEAGYETAAKALAANRRNAVWECYVAGLDPTNAASVLRATIRLENGDPVIGYEPTRPAHTPAEWYKVDGKRTLGDIWTPKAEGHRFFRVRIEIPEE